MVQTSMTAQHQQPSNDPVSAVMPILGGHQSGMVIMDIIAMARGR